MSDENWSLLRIISAMRGEKYSNLSSCVKGTEKHEHKNFLAEQMFPMSLNWGHLLTPKPLQMDAKKRFKVVQRLYWKALKLIWRTRRTEYLINDFTSLPSCQKDSV